MQGSLPQPRNIATVLQSHAPGLAEELAIFLAGQAPVAPENGGAFRDSISSESEAAGDGATVRVVSSDPKAEVIIFPTSAHTITGNPLLAWSGGKYGAGMHFAHEVHHPGTIGWVVQLEAMNERLLQMVDDELAVVVQEALTQ